MNMHVPANVPALASPTDEAMQVIKRWALRVVEIGAGDGAWLKAMHAAGISAIGFDIAPKGDSVTFGNHLAARKYCDRALLVVWPPDGSAIQEWLDGWCGDLVIIVGRRTRFDVGATLAQFETVFSCDLPGGRKGRSEMAVYKRGATNGV